MKKRLIFVLFLAIIFIITMLIVFFNKNKTEENKQTLVTIEDLRTERNVDVAIAEEFDMETVNEQEEIKLPELVSLGEFKLTAYCSCSKCCDGYANNRPVDENGNEIVYGSIGEELVEGVSIAVDPNVIPYGTKIVINGITYIAQDTGGAIDGNRIDVYHDDHQKAREFGVQYAEVFKLVE